MRLASITLAAAALAATATPLAATAPLANEEVVTVRIAFDDIDLTTAEGRAVLEQRIEAELRDACTVESELPYRMRRDVLDEDCVAEAKAEALAAVERVAAAEARAGGAISAN